MTIKLSSGQWSDNMKTLQIKNTNDIQLDCLEFFVIEHWLKKFCKEEWYISYSDFIYVCFLDIHDLCNFKMNKISKRYIVCNTDNLY